MNVCNDNLKVKGVVLFTKQLFGKRFGKAVKENNLKYIKYLFKTGKAIYFNSNDFKNISI